MSDKTNEKISAFIDAELKQQDYATLADSMASTTSRDKAQRYLMVSEILKGQASEVNARNVVDSVSRALQLEPTVLAPIDRKQSHTAGWKTWFAGGAIAASVAMLSLFNLGVISTGPGQAPAQFPGQFPEQFPVTVAVKPPETSLNNPYATAMAQPASTQWTTAGQSVSAAEIEKELNRFLIEHSEYTNQAGMPGMLPYATFVAYDKY